MQKSAANVAVVRGAYAAIERRDFPALLALLTPGVELHDPDLHGGVTFAGHAGVMRCLNEALGGFEQHGLKVAGADADQAPEAASGSSDATRRAGRMRQRRGRWGPRDEQQAGSCCGRHV